MKMLEVLQMAKIPEGFQNTGRFPKYRKVSKKIPEGSQKHGEVPERQGRDELQKVVVRDVP